MVACFALNHRHRYTSKAKRGLKELRLKRAKKCNEDSNLQCRCLKMLQADVLEWPGDKVNIDR